MYLVGLYIYKLSLLSSIVYRAFSAINPVVFKRLSTTIIIIIIIITEVHYCLLTCQLNRLMTNYVIIMAFKVMENLIRILVFYLRTNCNV